ESEEAKLRAESQVHEVSGVRGVANDLQVVPAAAARRVAAADEAVRRAIRERLGARDELDDARIDVEVKNGVARLTGTVASQRDRHTVLTLARRTEGVGAVVGALDLQPPKGGVTEGRHARNDPAGDPDPGADRLAAGVAAQPGVGLHGERRARSRARGRADARPARPTVNADLVVGSGSEGEPPR